MISSDQGKRSDKFDQRYRDYIDALEEELRKVQVFQRELPLCLDLVTQAIETWKQRLAGTTSERNCLSECSEQTSSPILEEFIPIHKDNLSDHSVCEEQELKNDNDKNLNKSDWFRFVQLGNQTPDPPPKHDPPRNSSVVELKSTRSGGAFHPFKKEKSVAAAVPPPSTSSTADTGSRREQKEGRSRRKTRRCWSPELHKRFMRALQKLGGSHVATPKQIRELMKVDGLTNDEVKSHLQKYRLHTRRPNTSSHSNNTQAHQFVVVGGIWVPRATAAATTPEADGGEASPSPKRRRHRPSSCDSGDIEGGDLSYSPAFSSSAQEN